MTEPAGAAALLGALDAVLLPEGSGDSAGDEADAEEGAEEGLAESDVADSGSEPEEEDAEVVADEPSPAAASGVDPPPLEHPAATSTAAATAITTPRTTAPPTPDTAMLAAGRPHQGLVAAGAFDLILGMVSAPLPDPADARRQPCPDRQRRYG
ncbi:hypothetical protein KGQ19_24865 [Catenulispora sp. NL8]|uniref:Uncharacterized protein n=1 Tax=Catenulispora pinistramenti TaxID=2705254 RepID=A0ABS5KVK9_9ACTN|nr:hypothetical protein [Catenulispora pinistramenti]MBS2550102.1 hypothetical protein [Catenulispora pinistramenti]